MSSQRNPSYYKKLKRAWHNFNVVINTLPPSDTTALLIFHTRNLLDKLANPPVDIDYVKTVTQRINNLVKTSEVVLDIDDMLKLVNHVLKSILAAGITQLTD
jgi:hypothetical protein